MTLGEVRRWLRVSRQAPCPVCKRPDWCMVSPDGERAYCCRVQGDGPPRPGGGWLHQVRAPFPSPRAVAATRPVAPPPASPEVAPLAPVATRDLAYRRLARRLGLAREDRDHLLAVRRLPPEAVDGAGFATWPGGGVPLAGLLGGAAGWSGVPGFWHPDRAGAGWETVRLPPAILVPVPDRDGRVQAWQARLRHPAPGEARYRWVSSRGRPRGASPGAPVSVWRPELARSTTWVTEGSLKAAIAAWHLPGGACFLGVAGVASWRPAIPELAALVPAAGRVVVAFDADADRNPAVGQARESLCRALHVAGHGVDLAAWDGARAKGIDDALLAGLPVGVAPWRRSLPPMARPRGRPFLEAS